MSTSQMALALVVFILLTFAVAGLGGLATRNGLPGWYSTLAKPSWTPPSWVFGPVWTLLYTTMAVAAWLVLLRGGWNGARGALILFAVHLAVNAAWSVLFFGCHRPGLALVDIVILWGMILALIVAFRRISAGAALLLVPYLLWVSFATVLNGAIWWLNR
jgi:benzodiazapine receptor